MVAQRAPKERANNRRLCVAFGGTWCAVADVVKSGDDLAVTKCEKVLIAPRYHVRLPTCNECRSKVARERR
jgi:hypothetical protein